MSRFGRWAVRNGRFVFAAALSSAESDAVSNQSSAEEAAILTNLESFRSLGRIGTEEINRATQYFSRNRDIVENAILPSVHFSEDEFIGLLNNASVFVSTLTTNEPQTISASNNQTLNQLQSHCACSICLGPKAAPVVLECRCANSYCGACILQWFDSGNQRCPLCRASITSDNVHFIRDFDEAIASLMLNVPDCETKQEWTTRRTQFLEYLEATGNEIGHPDEGGSDSDTEAGTPQAAFTPSIPAGIPEFAHRDPNQYLLYKQCIVILSMAILAMIKQFRV